MTDMSILTEALRLADKGIPVYPVCAPEGNGACSAHRNGCANPGKRPSSEHGFSDASTDREAIKGWFPDGLDANLGINTGGWGVVVVDVDPRNDGEETLKSLVADHGEGWLDTVKQQTGGGGQHLFFKAPMDVKLTGGSHKLGPGIDIKEGNSGVIASPSRHASGQPYAWFEDHSPFDREPSALPDWALEMLEETPPREVSGDGPPIYEGGRNNTLTSIAGSLRKGGLGEARLTEQLKAINIERCRPPLPAGEVEKIARSVSRYEAPDPVKKKLKLLTARELTERKPPDWVVRDLLPGGVLAEVIGEPGIGKSLLGLSIGDAVASGNDWIGHEVSQGPVVYVVAEGADHMGGRIAALEAHTGRDCQIDFVDEPVFMADESYVSALIEAIGDCEPKLVIFDTLARCMAGLEENSFKDVSSFVAGCDQLSSQLGSTVLLVHHPTKAKTSGSRGHGALDGALATRIKVEEKPDERLKVSCDKQNYAAPFDSFQVHKLPLLDTCVIVDDDAEVTSSASSLSPRTAKALEALKAFGEVGATPGAWIKASGMSESTFNRARKELVDGDYVCKKGGLYFVSPAELLLEDITL